MAPTTRKTAKASLPRAEGVPTVVLTVDTLLSLVDRLNALEGRVKSLVDEVQTNFDLLVEHIPTVTEDGKAMLAKVLQDGADGPLTVEIPFSKP